MEKSKRRSIKDTLCIILPYIAILMIGLGWVIFSTLNPRLMPDRSGNPSMEGICNAICSSAFTAESIWSGWIVIECDGNIPLVRWRTRDSQNLAGLELVDKKRNQCHCNSNWNDQPPCADRTDCSERYGTDSKGSFRYDENFIKTV